MVHYTRQFVFDCPSQRSPWPALNTTAKCYRASSTPPVDGLTLLFFHCTGTHKEHWEPIIEYLFSQSNSNHSKIREAWAFDKPTHGDAGVLNRELLERRTKSINTYDWISGVTQFLRSKHMRGHRAVLCGHCTGAIAAVLTAAEFYPSLVSAGIIGMILIEPVMMSPKLWQRDFQPYLSRGLAAVSSTKDHWKSKQDALLYFQNERQWNTWDPQVLRLYIERGLYELSDGTVIPKCSKKREMEDYTDMNQHDDGFACLGKLCHAIPVHTIWAEQRNFIPKSVQLALSNVPEDRPMASVTIVERAGHMIVQERPIDLARVINRILETIPFVSAERPKL